MNRFTALIRRYPIASVGLLVAVVAGVIWLRPKTPTAVVQPPPPAASPAIPAPAGTPPVAPSPAATPAPAAASPPPPPPPAGRGRPTDRRSRRHGPCGDTQDRRPGIHRCPGRDNPEQDPRRTGGRERRPRHPA